MSSSLNLMNGSFGHVSRSPGAAKRVADLREIEADEVPSVDRRQVLLRVVETWKAPSDFWAMSHLCLLASACNASDWLQWLQRFESYLRNPMYIFQLWKYGIYQLPATYIGPVDPIARNLASSLQSAATTAGLTTPSANGSGTSGSSSPSPQTSSSVTSAAKSRWMADAKHPLFESIYVNLSVMELQLINELYERMMSFIYDVFRQCIAGNKRAKEVASKYTYSEFQ